jgi:hypothetical protein
MSKDREEKFHEWFAKGTRNFFGSGLTVQEFLVLGFAERFRRSFGQQTLDERRRRLHFVVELMHQLDAIKRATNFATALAESAVMEVIEGDWSMVKTWAEHFGDDPHGDFAHCQDNVRELYAQFGRTLSDAALTVIAEDKEDN